MDLTRKQRWYAGAGALVIAGVLLALATAARWLPCLSGSAELCLARQSLGFDYLQPLRPHTTLMFSTGCAVLALLVLAAAPAALVGRRKVGPGLANATLAVLGGKPALFAVLVTVGSIAGGLPRPALWWLVLEILFDLAVVGVVLATSNDHREDYQRLLLFAVAVWAAGWVGRVADRVFFSLLTPEAPVPPGSGLIVALVVIACGVGVAAITRADEAALRR